MKRISRELQERVKAYRAKQLQELYEEQPGTKNFVKVRRVMLWTLRCIYLLNFLCGLAVMGTIGDFSQTGREILRLLIGMFFLWCASRTYQGALCLWLLVLGNVALIGQYIGMVYLILDPAFRAASPLAVFLYFIQLLFFGVLAVAAVYLFLPASHRYADAVWKVEKACSDMLMAEIR